jgi:hypothetical protein
VHAANNLTKCFKHIATHTHTGDMLLLTVSSGVAHVRQHMQPLRPQPQTSRAQHVLPLVLAAALLSAKL